MCLNNEDEICPDCIVEDKCLMLKSENIDLKQVIKELREEIELLKKGDKNEN